MQKDTIISYLLVIVIISPFLALSLYYQHNLKELEKQQSLQRFDYCIERFHPSDCATQLVYP